MRSIILTSVLFSVALLFAAPAPAIITDVNAVNGSCATAEVVLTRTKQVQSDGGRLSLTGCGGDYVTGLPGTGGGQCNVFSGDIDCFLIDNVRKGDIITAVTTPMKDEFRDYPDTIVGIFDASDPGAPSPGSLVEDTCGDFNITFPCNAQSDDSENNDIDFNGRGSLVRFRVPDSFVGANTFCVCVTGYDDPSFLGDHPDGLQEDQEGPFACVGADGVPNTGDEPIGSCTTNGNYQLMLIVTPPRPGSACGIGFEVGLILPVLGWLGLRRRRA